MCKYIYWGLGNLRKLDKNQQYISFKCNDAGTWWDASWVFDESEWWGKWMKLWELECLRMIVWWIPRRNSTKVRVVATTGLQGGQEERLEAARGGRGRGGRRHGGGGWAQSQVPQCQQLWEHMGPIFSLTIASIFSLSNRFCLVSLFWPFMFVFYLLTTLMAW